MWATCRDFAFRQLSPRGVRPELFAVFGVAETESMAKSDERDKRVALRCGLLGMLVDAFKKVDKAQTAGGTWLGAKEPWP